MTAAALPETRSALQDSQWPVQVLQALFGLLVALHLCHDDRGVLR